MSTDVDTPWTTTLISAPSLSSSLTQEQQQQEPTTEISSSIVPDNLLNKSTNELLYENSSFSEVAEDDDGENSDICAATTKAIDENADKAKYFDGHLVPPPRSSPSSSLTPLPPLPDLIPIRKSALSNQMATSSSMPMINTIRSSSLLPTIEQISNDPYTQNSELLINESERITEITNEELPCTNEPNDSNVKPSTSLLDPVQHSIEDSRQIHEETPNTEFINENGNDLVMPPLPSVQMTGTATLRQPNKRGRPKILTSKPKNVQNTNGVDSELRLAHRKSDRRRVARDIFFFFEQHPANRRRGRQKKNQKPCRGRPRTKCVTATPTTDKKVHIHNNVAAVSVAPTKTADTTTTKTSAAITTQTQKRNNSCVTTTTTNTAAVVKDNPPPAQPQSSSSSSLKPENLVPRVNPIFLWVKQDDTRIVEVRCEDYDKRNRIRLTKTANGWRAIPRTDPSTSRVVKLLPNPMVRVKQERTELLASRDNNHLHHHHHHNKLHQSNVHQSRSDEQQFDTEKSYHTREEDFVGSMKRSKKKKKKKKKRKKHKHEHDDDHLVDDLVDDDNISHIESLLPTPKDVIIYESTNHERSDDDIHLIDMAEPSVQQHESSPTSQQIALVSQTNSNNSNNNNNNSNSNETGSSSNLTKDLTQLGDSIELDMPFMHHLQNDKELCEPMMTLCPETGVFAVVNNVDEQIRVNDHVIVQGGFDPTDVACHDVDTKHLKDLLDDEDLLQHCDNAISGAELIDSLVKRGCEDNHISEDECHQTNHPSTHSHEHHNRHTHNNHQNLKNTICLTSDFDNEDDELLLEQEPVEDIISRLGESLATSPKCLSFNEAGEIEGLHGELFQTSTQSDPFNRSALEELSITIKDLEKSSENLATQQTTLCNNNNSGETVESTTTIVSPDSCLEELPKDLTCKKTSEINVRVDNQPRVPQQPQRSNSRSSDAIQSPQPSGLPAVPPSPDLMQSKNRNTFIDQLLSNTPVSPKICVPTIKSTPVKITKNSQNQKEPLDLGKHRKSASPTVSCSEEAKLSQTAFNDQNMHIGSDEPLQKRIKTEPSCMGDKNQNDSLAEMFASGRDPDPLTQLQLLISTPEWKVPDPILVPKDRLNAVLASPAREIPLLLTTRPELRLPEAFAYPMILQDPDILVISMAQLETILKKQSEIARLKPTPQQVVAAAASENIAKNYGPVTSNNNVPPQKTTTTKGHTQKDLGNPMPPLLGTGLANDIDAATLAAFNQMLWLPYLGQMAPELFKAMAGLPNSTNIADIFSLLTQQKQQQQQQQQRPPYGPQLNSGIVPNPMVFQNSLEFAMWQEALTQAQRQRNFKPNPGQREQSKKNSDLKDNLRQSDPCSNYIPELMGKTNPNARLLEELKKHQQEQTGQRSMIGINPFRPEHNRSHFKNEKMGGGGGGGGSGNINRSQNSLSSQHQNMGVHSEMQGIRKVKQQPQADQKPRVTCKSLMNLLQPERLMHQNDMKISNLMALPSYDFNTAGNRYQQQMQQQQLPHQHQQQTQQQQQQHHQQQQHLSQAQIQHQQPQFPQQNPNSGVNNSNNPIVGNNNNNNPSHPTQGKLKVKPGAHLLDPAAMQRRLINCEEIPEVGSTTNGLDDPMNDPNGPLWHPLFGSSQKPSYTSPWQWTTVTATGE